VFFGGLFGFYFFLGVLWLVFFFTCEVAPCKLDRQILRLLILGGSSGGHLPSAQVRCALARLQAFLPGASFVFQLLFRTGINRGAFFVLSVSTDPMGLDPGVRGRRSTLVSPGFLGRKRGASCAWLIPSTQVVCSPSAWRSNTLISCLYEPCRHNSCGMSHVVRLFFVLSNAANLGPFVWTVGR